MPNRRSIITSTNPRASGNTIYSLQESTMTQVSQFPQDLIGTWTLVAFESHDVDTNHTIYPFGEQAIGFIIYTNDGFMSAQLMNPSLRSDEESQDDFAESMGQFLAYSGPFEISDPASAKDNSVKVTHHLEVSSYPTWLGSRQERVATIVGDILYLSIEEPVVTEVRIQPGPNIPRLD